MDVVEDARHEARLASQTAANALARYHAALEQIADVTERLRVSGYAIRVSLDLLYEIDARGPPFSLHREPPDPLKIALSSETVTRLDRLFEGN